MRVDIRGETSLHITVESVDIKVENIKVKRVELPELMQPRTHSSHIHQVL